MDKNICRMKICTTCNIKKTIEVFSKQTSSKYIDTHKNTCRQCSNIINDKYRNTQTGYLKNLLKNAKKSSISRINKGRVEAGTFTITYDDVFEIWNLQKGLCYYSNIPMITNRKSDFQASIERIDPNKGYDKSNIVLSCLEFNDIVQWSKDKITEMIDILKEHRDLSTTDFSFKKKLPIEYNKLEFDKLMYHQCNKCCEIKSLDQFNKNKSIGCKSCVKILDNKRTENPRTALLILLTSARSNCKKRSSKNLINERDCSYDLNLEELIQIYRNQKGLCAYSNLPLCFGNSENINWRISLERKDTEKGYNVDNVCLICYEFNTGDKTILYKK